MSRKLRLPWTGPYRILGRLTGPIYDIAPLNGGKNFRVHASRLKPFVDRYAVVPQLPSRADLAEDPEEPLVNQPPPLPQEAHRLAYFPPDDAPRALTDEDHLLIDQAFKHPDLRGYQLITKIDYSPKYNCMVAHYVKLQRTTLSAFRKTTVTGTAPLDIVKIWVAQTAFEDDEPTTTTTTTTTHMPTTIDLASSSHHVSDMESGQEGFTAGDRVAGTGLGGDHTGSSTLVQTRPALEQTIDSPLAPDDSIQDLNSSPAGSDPGTNETCADRTNETCADRDRTNETGADRSVLLSRNVTLDTHSGQDLGGDSTSSISNPGVPVADTLVIPQVVRLPRAQFCYVPKLRPLPPRACAREHSVPITSQEVEPGYVQDEILNTFILSSPTRRIDYDWMLADALCLDDYVVPAEMSHWLAYLDYILLHGLPVHYSLVSASLPPPSRLTLAPQPPPSSSPTVPAPSRRSLRIHAQAHH